MLRDILIIEERWFDKMEDVKLDLSDDLIFSKLDKMTEKLKRTQELQKLSEEHGLDVKNSVTLTDDAIDNVFVSVIALLLAQQNRDTRYTKLVHTGMQKRSLKTEIINDYKNQANQYLAKYKNHTKDDGAMV